MLYDFSKMNIERTKSFLADSYDKHNTKNSDMLKRAYITRRVLSILSVHPDWDEDDVFSRVQNAFRKNSGSDIVKTIDRELYDYFKQNWLDIIKLEPITEGHEYDYYAKWSNKKLTKEEYVAKARAKWGDAYDYSESVYIAGLSPITIRCIKHNHYFTVQAGNHISTKQRRFSAGCPICAQERLTAARALQHEETLKLRALRENSIMAQIKKIRARKPKKTSQEIFIEKAKEKYPDYDYSKVEYKGRDTVVTLICPKHGEFEIRPRTLLSKEKGKQPHGCWECCGMKKPALCNSETFKEDVLALYGDKYVFHWEDYKCYTSQIRVECKLHGEHKISADAIRHGSACIYCNGRLYPKDWIKNAKAVHGDKYIYDESKPPRIKSDRIRYKCPIHGWQETRYDVHVDQKCGCPACAGYSNILSTEQRKTNWVKRCKKKYNDRFDYSQFVYVNNDTKGLVTCKEHHYSYMIDPWSHLRGAGGCPFCTGSEGEVHIRTWLENHHVNFVPQYSIPNENLFCKRQSLRVDFYLPDFRMFIEMNGEQHYKNIAYFHQDSWTFEDQQIRDESLRQYSKRHNVRLLVIKYDEINKIPNILSAALIKNASARKLA